MSAPKLFMVSAITSLAVILIENEHYGKAGNQSAGRTDGHKLVALPKLAPGASNKVGDWVRAKITGATPNGLKGKAVR